MGRQPMPLPLFFDLSQQNAWFKRQFLEFVETGEIFDACLIPDILMNNP